MPRKKRLGRLPKNYECLCRQKSSLKRQVTQTLSNPSMECDGCHIQIGTQSVTLPRQWNVHQSDGSIKLAKLQAMPSIRKELLLLTRSVVISPNGWQAHVNSRSVPKSPVLQSIPDVFDGKSLLRLLDILETTRVCAGHPDEKFLTMSDSQTVERKS